MGNIGRNTIKDIPGNGGIVGLGTSIALLFFRHCLRNPGVQAYANHLLGRIFPFLNDKPTKNTEVALHADAVATLFRERSLVPSRLAIDGPPGSGKSSLARALADRMNMDVVCLDHQDMDNPQNFAKSGAIFEHHRLLRTQNLDAFDAVIYIDEPVSLSQDRVIRRKRGGYLVVILNYELLKRIGDKAFLCISGATTSIADRYRIKLRPPGGFRCRELIQQQLHDKHYDGVDLSKEESLFVCVEGVRKCGFKAYLNVHAFDKEFFNALTESALFPACAKDWRR